MVKWSSIRALCYLTGVYSCHVLRMIYTRLVVLWNSGMYFVSFRFLFILRGGGGGGGGGVR